MTIGEDRWLYVYDYRPNPPKHLYAFNYADQINDPTMQLSSVRWCPFDPAYLMAYCDQNFVVISRAVGATFPLYYRCCHFDGIADATFLPFASNCIVESP